jgi:hypothetical protein
MLAALVYGQNQVDRARERRRQREDERRMEADRKREEDDKNRRDDERLREDITVLLEAVKKPWWGFGK